MSTRQVLPDASFDAQEELVDEKYRKELRLKRLNGIRGGLNLIKFLVAAVYVPFVLSYVATQVTNITETILYVGLVLSMVGLIDVGLQLRFVGNEKLTTWKGIVLDLIASLPVLPILLAIGGTRDASSYVYWESLKLLQTIQLPVYKRSIAIGFPGYVATIPTPVRRLSKLFYNTFVWGNVTAAIYFALSKAENLSWIDWEDLRYNDSSLAYSGDEATALLSLQLIRSNYFIVQTLLTVGFGDNAPESDNGKLFSIVLCVAGVLVLSYIVANMSSLFVNLNATSSKFMSSLDQIQSVMKKHKIDALIQRDVRTAMDNVWSTRKGLLVESMIESLPPGIQRNLKFLLFERQLMACRLFHGLDDQIISAICEDMEERREYPIDATLVEVGSFESCICILVAGKVQTLEEAQEDGLQDADHKGYKKASTIEPGGTLGLLSCFLGMPSSYKAIALEPVEVMRISLPRLKSVIEKSVQNPKEAAIIFNNLTDSTATDTAAAQALALESSRISTSPLHAKQLLSSSKRSTTSNSTSGGTSAAEVRAMKLFRGCAVMLSAMLLLSESFIVVVVPLLTPFINHPAQPSTARLSLIVSIVLMVDLVVIASLVVHSEEFVGWLAKKENIMARVIRQHTKTELNRNRRSHLSVGTENIKALESVQSESSTIQLLQEELKQKRAKQRRRLVLFTLFTIGVVLSFVTGVQLDADDVSEEILVRWIIMRWFLMVPYFHFFSRSIQNLESLLRAMGIRFASNQLLAARLCIGMLVFLHLASCWACIALANSLFPSSASPRPVPSLSSYYVKAFYWVLVNITTVGFGDVTPSGHSDTLFTIVMMCVGVTTFSGIISFATLLMNSEEVTELSVDHRRNVLTHYMLDREISSALQAKVQAYFDYVQQRNLTVQNEVLGIDDVTGRLLPTSEVLPGAQRFDILRAILGDSIASCPLFSGKFSEGHVEGIHDSPTSPGFLKALISRLEHQVFVPQEVLLVDSQARILFFTHGQGELRDASGAPLRLIKPGNSYGLDTFFPSDSSAKQQILILEYSEGWWLHKSDLALLKPEFPNTLKAVDDVLEKLEGKVLYRMRSQKSSKSPHVVAGATETAISKKSPPKSTLKLLGQKSRPQKVFRVVRAIGATLHVVILPFQLAILDPSVLYMDSSSRLVGSMLVDLFFILDFVLHLCWFTNSAEVHALVYRKSNHRWNVFVNYLGSVSGVLDLLAALPLDWFALVVNPLASLRYITILRLNRLLCTRHLTQFLITLGSGIQNQRTKAVVIIAKLLFAFSLAVHVLGCLFFLVAVLEDEAHMDALEVPLQEWSWAAKKGINTTHLFGIVDLGGVANMTMCDESGQVLAKWSSAEISQQCTEFGVLLTRYLVSAYWTVGTMTCVGYGDVVPSTFTEYLFAILVLLVGVMIFSIVISNLEQIVAQSDATSILFQSKNDSLKKYLAKVCLPDALRVRVSNYMIKLWINNRGVPESTILSFICPSLRTELITAQCPNIHKDLPVIGANAFKISYSLLPEAQVELYGAKESVYTAGEHSTALYYLVSGTIDLVSEDGGTVYSSIKAPGVFGANEFFREHQFVSGATVNEDATVLTISRKIVAEYLHRNDHLKPDYERMVVSFTMRKASGVDGTRQNLKSRKITQLMNIAGEDLVKKPWDPVLLPNSKKLRIWNIVMLVTSLYFMLTVPFKIGFLQQYDDSGVKEVYLYLSFVDWFFWALLLANSVGKARFFARAHGGVLIKEQSEITKNYLGHELPGDFIALFPWYTVVSLATNPWTGSIANLLRLTVLRALGNQLESMDGFIDEMQVYLRSGTRHLAKLVAVVCVACHWIACGRSLVLWSESSPGPSDIASNYVGSLYYATYTLTTVGFGNVAVSSNLQKLYAVAGMVLGSFLCDAGLTSTMCSIIESGDIVKSESNRTRECTRFALESRNVPRRVVSQVEQFFDYKETVGGNLNERVILTRYLPAVFRAETVGHIVFRDEDNVFACKLLANMSFGMLRSLATLLRPVVFTRGEVVLAAGAPLDRLVCVVEGRVMECRDAHTTRQARRRTRLPSTLEASVVHSGILARNQHLGNVLQQSYVAVATTTAFVCAKEDLEAIFRTEYTLAGKFRNLKELLDDSAASAALHRFAATCQATDDLCFFREVELYRRCAEGSQKQESQCNYITKRFVQDGAPQQVSLLSDTRSTILSNVASCPTDIFDQGQEEVLVNLGNYLLPRFTESEEYYQLMLDYSQGRSSSSILQHRNSNGASTSGSSFKGSMKSRLSRTRVRSRRRSSTNSGFSFRSLSRKSVGNASKSGK